MDLKQPLSPLISQDAATAEEVPSIDIHHPCYPTPLLNFPALDDGGADYNLVFYACCILVGNAWFPVNARAYLTLTPDPSNPIPISADGILREKKYWLHLPGWSDKGKFFYTTTYT
ncbi:uncharacterized protein F4822DRAFT_404584 [Hypoxylon trugodes]|uniref:uncharacterized protein n=1 Tax=Hypoxylon trugodes TaxID=326681 RepID=UPI0021A06D5C|nr:uncharacterized protein F4822DRAFT_404584 [Hypoxylon trugodes]KAI1388977.1 hypothetical protein F4822DRAFT_404584 [Hypoxylon trugodes]